MATAPFVNISISANKDLAALRGTRGYTPLKRPSPAPSYKGRMRGRTRFIFVHNHYEYMHIFTAVCDRSSCLEPPEINHSVVDRVRRSDIMRTDSASHLTM